MTEARTEVSIADLSGVWRRSLLIDGGGTRDETSRVWWLQHGAVCGDIRASAGASVAETAFAGRLLLSDGVFTWSPEISLGSVTDGAPDEGRLAFEGDILREDGVHSPYLEHWRRVATSGPDDRAIRFRVEGAAQPGFLIEIGPMSFCARPRARGEPAFLLAAREGGASRVVMALGCAARPGAVIDLPFYESGVLRFRAGPTGEDAAFPAQRLHAAPETSER